MTLGLLLFLSTTALAHNDHSNSAKQASNGKGAVIPLDSVKEFTNNGNILQGLATKSKGAAEHEVWRSQIAPGSKTPLHSHDSEETFVVLRGEGIAKIGDETLKFKAPCTIIAPAGVPHQVINTGKVATESIVIVRIDSKIKTASNKVLDLPWRQ